MRALELEEVVVDAVVGRNGERAALANAAAERLAEPLDLFLRIAKEGQVRMTLLLRLESNSNAR